MHAGDKRTLVVTDKNPGCELNYTKGGQTSVVASSRSSVEYCDGKAASIRLKLEGSGFTCKYGVSPMTASFRQG